MTSPNGWKPKAEPPSGHAVELAVRGIGETIREAIRQLVIGGYLIAQEGPRGFRYRSVRPFGEDGTT
jgi:hypothetical protein